MLELAGKVAIVTGGAGGHRPRDRRVLRRGRRAGRHRRRRRRARRGAGRRARRRRPRSSRPTSAMPTRCRPRSTSRSSGSAGSTSCATTPASAGAGAASSTTTCATSTRLMTRQPLRRDGRLPAGRSRHMAAHGGGSIVNTTSIGGINAGGGLMTYRATKAAVVHLTRCIAIDLAEHGVRVNCVAPAHIPTDINATYDQEAIVRLMQPLQRIGSPRDVANAVMYLASDRAAQVTGIVLPVDGGTTAGPADGEAREGPRRNASRVRSMNRDLLLRRPPRSLRGSARRCGSRACRVRSPTRAPRVVTDGRPRGLDVRRPCDRPQRQRRSQRRGQEVQRDRPRRHRRRRLPRRDSRSCDSTTWTATTCRRR